MGIMLKFIGVILASLVGINGSQNDIIRFPNIVDILKSDQFVNHNGSFENISEPCLTHLNQFKNALGKEIWALTMADSVVKFPDGILMGRADFPGHFDECVDVIREEFQGKHCMVRAIVKFPINSTAFMEREVRYGSCVPSTCTAADIQILLQKVKESGKIHDKILSYISRISIDDTDCSTNELRPLRSEDWLTISVLTVLILLALASTVYDMVQRWKYKNDKPSKLWLSFSIYTNFQQLFGVSDNVNQMKYLYGIRSLSFAWVILAHTYFTFIYSAPLNFFDIPKMAEETSFIPIGNAFVSVDSFFFLSGLLVCVVFFRSVSRKGGFDVPVAFIHRYLRLTPPFAILMLIQSTLISRIANGPFWNRNIDDIERGCRDVWWSGLLYIQNYAKSTTRCLGQSWYLSADMQMFWVSPLILYPLLWWPYLAPYFLSVITLAAALTSFSVGFVNKLNPNMSIVTRTKEQFRLEYSPFHTRMAPWLIGLATGYIICGMKAKKIRINLSPFWVGVGWIVGIGLCGASIFAYERFHHPGYTQVEASLYLAFHRVGWSFGLAWVVIACEAGYGGAINSFLSLNMFQPLAKLSYCNFLIHMSLQQIRLFSSRTNQYIRHFDIVHLYFGDLLLSNLVSIPIYLLFEIPFMHLDRHFLQNLKILLIPNPKEKKKIPDSVKVEKPELKEGEKGKINPGFVESTNM